MKLVLEILSHTEDTPAQHRVIDKFPVTLGRGFHNDIILTDPHIDSLHFSIDHAAGQWVVNDLGSDNGVSVNNRRIPARQSASVASGDVVRAGLTELRFYSPNHPVAETAPVPAAHPAFRWLAHPLTVWLAPLLAVIAATGWAYLEIWTDEPGMVMAAAATAAGGTILVWSALWSVAGRVISRRQAHFRDHAALISLFLLAALAGWYVKAYADFLFNENALADLITYSINFILLAGLLYHSLALASRLKQERRTLVSAAISAGVTVGIFILTLIGTKTFIQQPVYAATLEPYLSWLAPADTPDEFMKGSENLFLSKEFRKKD